MEPPSAISSLLLLEPNLSLRQDVQRSCARRQERAHRRLGVPLCWTPLGELSESKHRKGDGQW